MGSRLRALLPSRMEERFTVLMPEGGCREYTTAARDYTLTELAGMLRTAGLELQAHFGDLKGSALTLHSRQLGLVGRNRQHPSISFP
jgi:hypothetical protein